MITKKSLFIVPALIFAAFCSIDSAEAQVKPGKYTLVGAFNAASGGGFHGTVNIRKAGPVKVKLNSGATLRGRIDNKGTFSVTSVLGSSGSIRASGSASMRSKTYAIGRFNVVGEGSGIFMLGRN